MHNSEAMVPPVEPVGKTSRMTIWVIRAFFLLVSAGTGVLIAYNDTLNPGTLDAWECITGMIGLYLVVMSLEMLLRSASDISAVMFGLIVGMILALLSHSLVMLAFPEANEQAYSSAIRLILLCLFCYLSVVLVFKTRHRFNFIIPYVEFHRQQRGPRAMLLDTSTIIDGRIADICDTRVFDTPIIIPRFILRELQAIADSEDKMKRVRGRRGLDVVNRLQKSSAVEVIIEEGEVPGGDSVDSKLVRLAGSLGGRVVTNDFNLNKVAQIQGVTVVNINDLANALRPSFIPGEHMNVQLMREGAEPGQGVGYLDDGTMVVAEDGLNLVGKNVSLEVTRTLQTSAGKMIFGKVVHGGNSTRGKKG